MFKECYSNRKNCENKSITKLYTEFSKNEIQILQGSFKGNFSQFGTLYNKRILKDGICYEYHEYHDKQNFMLVYHVLVSNVHNVIGVFQKEIRFKVKPKLYKYKDGYFLDGKISK